MPIMIIIEFHNRKLNRNLTFIFHNHMVAILWDVLQNKKSFNDWFIHDAHSIIYVMTSIKLFTVFYTTDRNRGLYKTISAKFSFEYNYPF